MENTDIRVQMDQQGPPQEFPVGIRVIARDTEYLQEAKEFDFFLH